VRSWLAAARLSRFTDVFIENGYDDPELVSMLGDDDFDAMGITQLGFRKRLRRLAALLPETGVAPPFDVADWLKSGNCEAFAQTFIDNGYDERQLIIDLQDEDLDALGITQLGFRKKLRLMATRLAKAT
jgi:hypothetical protein